MTPGEVRAKRVANMTDTPTTVTGSHNSTTFFLTSMAVIARSAISMFAFDKTIGRLSVPMPYASHIMVPDKLTSCEAPDTPSTFPRAYTRTTCGQMKMLPRIPARYPENDAADTEQQ